MESVAGSLCVCIFLSFISAKATDARFLIDSGRFLSMNTPLLPEEEDEEEENPPHKSHDDDEEDIQIQAQNQQESAFLSNKKQEYKAKIAILKADIAFLKQKNRQEPSAEAAAEMDHRTQWEQLTLRELVVVAKNLQGKLQEAQEKGLL